MARPAGASPGQRGRTPGRGSPPARGGGAVHRPAPQRQAPRAAGRAGAERGWAEGGSFRIRLTPSVVLLGIAVGIAGAFIIWGLLSRDAEQVPMLASGLLVMGVVLAIAAAVAARDTYRAARAGYAGRAFVLALAGGSFALAAGISTAGASILGMIWVS